MASDQWKNEIGVLEMFLSFYDSNCRGGTLRDCLYDVLAFYEENALRQEERAAEFPDAGLQWEKVRPRAPPLPTLPSSPFQPGEEGVPGVSGPGATGHLPEVAVVKPEAVEPQETTQERWHADSLQEEMRRQQQPLSLPCDVDEQNSAAFSLTTYFPPAGDDFPQTSGAEQGEVGVSSAAMLQKQRRRVECPICHKNFSSQTVLRQHERVHTDERPYSCPLCSKSYKHKHRLKDHMLQHSGSKPYKCHVCHKPFRRSDSLKTHLQVHVNHRQRMQRQMAAFSVQDAVLGQLRPLVRPVGDGRETETGGVEDAP